MTGLEADFCVPERHFVVNTQAAAQASQKAAYRSGEPQAAMKAFFDAKARRKQS